VWEIPRPTGCIAIVDELRRTGACVGQRLSVLRTTGIGVGRARTIFWRRKVGGGGERDRSHVTYNQAPTLSFELSAGLLHETAATHPPRHFSSTSSQHPSAKGMLSVYTSLPFRFLDLPKDIRLLVYELFPVVTRLHTIAAAEAGPSHTTTRALAAGGGGIITSTEIGPGNTPVHILTILSYRIPGISLLATCRATFDEAVSIRRSISAITNTPLRLKVNWYNMGSAALEAILLCTSRQEYSRSRHLRALLALDARGCYDSVSMFMGFIMHPDFDTHEKLHDLLRRSEKNTGKTRHAKISIQCDGNMLLEDQRWRLISGVYDFYN